MDLDMIRKRKEVICWYKSKYACMHACVQISMPEMLAVFWQNKVLIFVLTEIKEKDHLDADICFTVTEQCSANAPAHQLTATHTE